MKDFNGLFRGYTLSMSVVPFLVALGCAINAPFAPDKIFVINSIAVLLGIVCIHCFTNLFDDYVDVKTKLKEGFDLGQINFKSKRKASAILKGDFSIKTVEIILVSLVLVAVLIGGYFTYLRGSFILLYMIVTGVLALCYPKSSYFGMAELIVGVVFGPLLVNASYFALTGQTNFAVFCFSIATGFVTSILHIAHSLMDYEFDVEAGKKTLPIILKDKNNTIRFIKFAIIAADLSVFWAIMYYNLSEIFMLPLILVLPCELKLISSLREYIQIKDVQFIPKWYFGLMENWEEIVKNNYAYYMFRFYLARNVAVIFGFFLAVACFVAFEPSLNINIKLMDIFWSY